MPSPKVFLALPSYGLMPAHFVQCLMRLLAEQPCSLTVKLIIGDSLVSRARNTLTAEFLASDATHLLFVDTDLIFSPEHVARLLGHDVPIVGGFYPKKQDGKLEWVCNAHLHFPPPDERGLQSLRYIGTGFLLVKREVFERMRIEDRAPSYTADGSGREEHDYWSVGVYQGPDGGRRYLSEDWMFCQRALDLGYDVLGDPHVICKHIGTAVFPLMSQNVDVLAEQPCPLAHCPESHKAHVAAVFAGEYAIPLDPPPATVLDIGACVGAFTAWASLQWPAAEIEAFEPHPENAALFHKNFDLPASHHIAFMEVGVRAESGIFAMATGLDNCGEASFHRATPAPVRVQCVAANLLRPAEFVKIDTEGCELEILRGLDLSATRAIALEYHSAEDRQAIRQLLCDSGFIEHGNPPLQPIGILKFKRQ